MELTKKGGRQQQVMLKETVQPGEGLLDYFLWSKFHLAKYILPTTKSVQVYLKL